MPGQLRKRYLDLPHHLLNNRKAATHFLCLPLCTQRSQSKLQNLVQTLKEDKGSATVPPGAFRLPKSFVLRFHNLRIETRSELWAAREIFRDIARKQSLATPPLKIALEGLTASLNNDGRDLADTNQMWCFLRDSSSSGLKPFMQDIRKKFDSIAAPQKQPHSNTMGKLAAQNLISTRYTPMVHASAKEAGVLGTRRSPDRPSLLGKFKATVWPDKPLEQSDDLPHRLIAPRFDPRRLLQKFENNVWAEDIQIEKLSLCKEGRVKSTGGPKNDVLLDEWYEEVASIPFSE